MIFKTLGVALMVIKPPSHFRHLGRKIGTAQPTPYGSHGASSSPGPPFSTYKHVAVGNVQGIQASDLHQSQPPTGGLTVQCRLHVFLGTTASDDGFAAKTSARCGNQEGRAPPGMKIAVVIATRPDVIKMAPVIRALAKSSTLAPLTISTSQHRQLLQQVFKSFGIRASHECHSL